MAWDIPTGFDADEQHVREKWIQRDILRLFQLFSLTRPPNKRVSFYIPTWLIGWECNPSEVRKVALLLHSSQQQSGLGRTFGGHPADLSCCRVL
jgi:hypothetical protein